MQCLYRSVMTLSVDQTIVKIKKKEYNSLCDDVGEARIYQRQKFGT